MVIVEYYQDLLGEIELLEWLHEDLVRQLKFHNKREVWGHIMPLDKALNKYDNIIERMKHIEAEIEIKKQLKKRFDDRLRSLKGMEFIVFHGRSIEGKSLQEIASENHCSYSRVSKVSMKLYSEKSVKDKVAIP